MTPAMRSRSHSIKQGLKICLSMLFGLILLIGLSACGLSPRVTAQERTFLSLSLEFLDRYELPKTAFNNTPIGGLSALAYDRRQDLFYVLSDDRSQLAPARFYTLSLSLNDADGATTIADVAIHGVTFLAHEQGEYASGDIDPEGIALSPRGTLFIASEGVPSRGVAPFIGEFDPQSGNLLNQLRVPARYLPGSLDADPQGVQENLGFESLTLSPSGLAADDPFRLFTATESSLLQDIALAPEAARLRFLHYVIGPVGDPIVLAEHLYLLDEAPSGAIANGLTELVTLEKEGYFLSLERTYKLSGAGAKIFQVVVGNATDTSGIDSLKNLGQVVPLKKNLLFDLGELGINLDNLEGMALGPHLSDGSQSLVLLSDDNFKEEQVTQLLLFRLQEKTRG
ncbi:MAG: esterase-like activity of phytase family protein [Cyanophyceae cyanobacterium]